MLRFLAHALLAAPSLLMAGFMITPSPVDAQNSERDVVQVVERLFEGMRTRDTTMMRSTFHSTARMYGKNQNGEITASSPDGFITSVGGTARMLDEKIFDPVVHIDGDVASVWTYYTLHVDEEFSHCGIDTFIMINTTDGWKIVSLADTRRRENCTQME